MAPSALVATLPTPLERPDKHGRIPYRRDLWRAVNGSSGEERCILYSLTTRSRCDRVDLGWGRLSLREASLFPLMPSAGLNLDSTQSARRTAFLKARNSSG